jgi:homeobox KN domain-containing protein
LSSSVGPPNTPYVSWVQLNRPSSMPYFTPRCRVARQRYHSFNLPRGKAHRIMSYKQSDLPDAADLDSFFDLGPAPTLDMASFLNDALNPDPASDDFASWNPSDNDPGGGGALLDDTAHQTPISSREPSTGPSTPGLGQPRGHATKAPPSKPANRFSSESVRLLRQWLKDHESHPYATAHDLEILQGRTGLTKQQVNNWLSNARRRYKFHTPPVSSRLGRAQVVPDSTSAGQTPIDIPRRRPTPLPFESMNPLERWESSPPDHEPATVADISRIMAATPASASTPSYLRGSDVSSSDASSVSSFSRSSRGSGSSTHTGSLVNSLGPLNASRKKRRKATRRQMTRRTNLLQPCHTYQCTFCIETFKHKYDWQRHEKSLHLSLEEWVCSPTGPTALNSELGLEVCVYCGAAEPSQSHLETHHHLVCQERTPEHRTFYRKDHLRQHLKLVHESNFMPWPMEQWKTQGREIKSRCGFCNQQLETWIRRTDHLAEHFKSGYTMAEWKGDWGFDSEVLDIVDNAMPPCTLTLWPLKMITQNR